MWVWLRLLQAPGWSPHLLHDQLITCGLRAPFSLSCASFSSPRSSLFSSCSLRLTHLSLHQLTACLSSGLLSATSLCMHVCICFVPFKSQMLHLHCTICTCPYPKPRKADQNSFRKGSKQSWHSQLSVQLWASLKIRVSMSPADQRKRGGVRGVRSLLWGRRGWLVWGSCRETKSWREFFFSGLFRESQSVAVVSFVLITVQQLPWKKHLCSTQ